MSAAAAMRLTRLHGDLDQRSPGQRTPATARRCRYSPGLIRRLITVTDREGVVLSSGARTGMPPAAGCPVTDLTDMGGSSRAALAVRLGAEGIEALSRPSQRVTVIAATGQSLMPRPRTLQ
jgi:hypothetical protein